MRLYFIRNISLLLLFSVLLPGIFCYGQEVYFVNGKVLIEANEFNNVTVTLTDNTTFKNLSVTPSCSFSAKLQWNNKYYFKFQKPGYVTKIIEFSTHIPNDYSHRIEPYLLNVRLFPLFRGVDTVFFKKPVAKVYFDNNINDFTDDRDYALQVIYAIEQMRKRAKDGFSTKKDNRNIYTLNNIKKTDNEKIIVSNSLPLKDSKDPHANKLIDVEIKQKVYGKCLLPPLKKNYVKKKTVEEFSFEDKHITRVIIRNGNEYNVYFRVKHNWGGVYHFIDESPLGVFSITENLFERRTKEPVISKQ